MERPGAEALGYRQPILQGVWQRVQTFGVLRLWGHCWAAFWLMVGLWTLTYLGFTWLILPVVCWLLGHGILALLTQWNASWDEMLGAHWRRRYKAKYDA